MKLTNINFDEVRLAAILKTTEADIAALVLKEPDNRRRSRLLAIWARILTDTLAAENLAAAYDDGITWLEMLEEQTRAGGYQEGYQAKTKEIKKALGLP